jgi:hypothetical protein
VAGNAGLANAAAITAANSQYLLIVFTPPFGFAPDSAPAHAPQEAFFAPPSRLRRATSCVK